MNKKISLGAAIAFMIVIAGITFCITMMVSLNHFNTMVLNVKSREEMYKKIADIDKNIRQNYYGVIDEEVLSDAISQGYIKGLGDKYAVYLSKDEYEHKLLEKNDKLVQIGVETVKDSSGYFKVTKVINDTPAANAGILKDDLLISVDGNDLKSISEANIADLLEGEVGTKINIIYRRSGIDTQKELQRKSYDVEYIEYYAIDSIGYMKINDFNSKSLSQFKIALNALIQQDVTGLIFDVRNTSSDDMDTVVSILNYLLPAGDLGTIVDKSGISSVLATSDKYQIELPMTVLINAKTANAAEYFAATLRDFNKANCVGVTSIGKSIKQETFKLTDGSAVIVTTAYVYPPSGNDINGIGVKPDYEVKLTAEQEQSFATLTYENDPQVIKAIEVVTSKIE